MFSLERFETHVQALMETLVAAAVTEVRRLLLTGCWRTGVSAPEHSAGGESGEAGRPAVARITDRFVSLMKACIRDVLQQTTAMVKASMCAARPEPSTGPQDGRTSEHAAEPAARSRSVRKGLQQAVTKHRDHLYCRGEPQSQEPAEAAYKSETEPVMFCSPPEDATSEPPPTPEAVPLHPSPDLSPGDPEENGVKADPEPSETPRKKAKSFQCPSCEKTFAKKCLMERHNLNHTKPHTCSHCGKRFATLRALTPHTRKHTGEKLYGCPDCGIRFAYKHTFDRHMRSHGRAALCARPSASPQRVAHTCPLCEAQFATVFLFQRHRCAALRRTFVCSVCPETFECRRSLAGHESLHSASRDFVCEMCGERFISLPSLAAHRVVHFQGENDGAGGRKPYSCDVCGKALSHRSALKHHMLKHTGEKEYVCETCGKRCGHASALQNHMRVHTGRKPGETPACGTCGKTFASACNLKHHMSIHTGRRPYACGDCGKAFNNPSNLKTHTLIHRSTKTFGCDVCGRRFAQLAGLKQHRQLHVGKTFGCGVCGKGFVLKSQLRRHERNHVSEEAGEDEPAERADQTGTDS